MGLQIIKSSSDYMIMQAGRSSSFTRVITLPDKIRKKMNILFFRILSGNASNDLFVHCSAMHK